MAFAFLGNSPLQKWGIPLCNSGEFHLAENIPRPLWSLQRRVFTTGEINFRLASEEVRDRALESLLGYFTAEGAHMRSQTAEGIDLQGTVVGKGLDPDTGAPPASDRWYSGYLRIATNEKAVLRVYLSAGRAACGRRIAEELREILRRHRAQEID